MPWSFARDSCLGQGRKYELFFSDEYCLTSQNMATADLVDTTAGSWALLGSEVPRDAFVVARVRDAGAVILGHSNMGEWASVRSKSYSTGYSPRRGQTRNAFDLSKSPCTQSIQVR